MKINKILCSYRNICLYFLLSLLSVLSLKAQETFNIGSQYSLESDILGEQRTYWISLPASYEGDDFYIDKKYPILILLDGERLFHLVSGMVHTMASGGVEQIPEMIVVGVNNTNRSRDMFPIHAENASTKPGREETNRFRRFLTEELIPRIEEAYRTNSCKILVGHSLGGLFALDSFLEESEFNGYLAIDPSLWWENQRLNQRAKAILQEKNDFNVSVYISQANNPFNEGLTAGRMGQAIQAFKAVMEAKEIKDLRYSVDFFEKEDHFSVPLTSIYDGLQFLFEGYKYPLNQIRGKKGSDIDEHYKDLSNRLGGELIPPGKLLNQVGLFLLRSEGQIKEALEILEINKQYYPNSFIPYSSLGEGYSLEGNTSKALENFQKSLALNPANEEIQTRIAELKNQ